MSENDLIDMIADWEDALMQQRIWWYQWLLLRYRFDA